MALRRIEIADLKAGPVQAPVPNVADVPPALMDLPLEVFLGLRPGDQVSLGGGGATVTRATGETEEVRIGR